MSKRYVFHMVQIIQFLLYCGLCLFDTFQVISSRVLLLSVSDETGRKTLELVDLLLC